MTDTPRCLTGCTPPDGDSLNRQCTCAVVDVAQIRNRLAAQLVHGEAVDSERHAHLFSPHALFVDRASLDAMAAVASAVLEVATCPAYIDRVLDWAPAIASHDPGSPGGVFGLDFHLTVEGPRLIEVNTNPGGLLLNALLLDGVEACAPASWAPTRTSTDARAAAVDAWLEDARAQLGRAPTRIAVVDLDPPAQFLYPEFELYAAAFQERGLDCVICDPDALTWDGTSLRDASGTVDFVYNRLTDFALQDPASAAIRAAFLADAVALTPHPRAHALLADKRNLAVLGDGERLRAWGIAPDVSALLSRAIPETFAVDGSRAEQLWERRKDYFFKPATGFGSRGSYRGDKLTRRVWESIEQGIYVAQRFAPPSLRVAADGTTLKADVRCFVNRDSVLMFAARLYQGQTTNMRTAGGGFAAVLTTPRRPASAE